MFITSNNEKELPDAFLRRCFFHYIKFPDADTMKRIVDVHFPGLKKELLGAAMKTFYDVRNLPGLKKKPSTSELLDWLKLLVAEDIPLEALQSKDDKVAVPPLVGALLKNEQDVHPVREARVHAAPQPLKPMHRVRTRDAGGRARAAGAAGLRARRGPARRRRATASCGTFASPACPRPTTRAGYVERRCRHSPRGTACRSR